MIIELPNYNNMHGLGVFLYDEVLLKDSYGFRWFYREATDPEAVEGILDIGANIGFFSIQAAVLFPHAKRVAIEPSTDSFHLLNQNVNYLNTQCIQVAMGNGEPVSLIKFSENTGCNLFFSEGEGETLPSYSLAQLFELYLNVERYMLKIDCEGAEGWLVGDSASEKILQKAWHIGLEFHEMYLKNPRCPNKTAWHDWMQDLFAPTHQIKQWTNPDGTEAWVLTHQDALRHPAT
jgi:FkbM family methyltransferase